MTELVSVDKEKAADAGRASAVEFLQEAIVVLDDLVRANTDDTAGLIRTHNLVGQMLTDLRAVRDEAKRLAVGNLGPKETVDVDGQRYRRSAKPEREWNPKGVEAFLSVVVGRAITKAQDADSDPIVEVIRALRSVLTAAKPKVTALRAYKVDPDDISTVTWSSPCLKAEPVPETQAELTTPALEEAS